MSPTLTELQARWIRKPHDGSLCAYDPEVRAMLKVVEAAKALGADQPDLMLEENERASDVCGFTCTSCRESTDEPGTELTHKPDCVAERLRLALAQLEEA